MKCIPHGGSSTIFECGQHTLRGQLTKLHATLAKRPTRQPRHGIPVASKRRARNLSSRRCNPNRPLLLVEHFVKWQFKDVGCMSSVCSRLVGAPAPHVVHDKPKCLRQPATLRARRHPLTRRESVVAKTPTTLLRRCGRTVGAL